MRRWNPQIRDGWIYNPRLIGQFDQLDDDPWQVSVAALLEINATHILEHRHVFGEMHTSGAGFVPHFNRGHIHFENGHELSLEDVAVAERAMRLGFDAFPDVDYECQNCEMEFNHCGIDHTMKIVERKRSAPSALDYPQGATIFNPVDGASWLF